MSVIWTEDEIQSGSSSGMVLVEKAVGRIDYLEDYRVKTVEDGSTSHLEPKCPSEYTHRWKDEIKVGDVCFCATWQIIKIIHFKLVVCKDIEGNTQEFCR